MRTATLCLLATLASCGRDQRLQELERRVALAEALLEQRQEADARLEDVLRENGILFHASPPADEAEAVERSVQALRVHAHRLEQAKETRNAVLGQSAMDAIQQIGAELETHRVAALPLLLEAARSENASGPQTMLLATYARIGGKEVLSELTAIESDASAPNGLRFQALRSLLELAPALAADRIGRRVAKGAPGFPDLYFLVHALAESRVPEAVPVLCRALEECDDISVRCHAATGLGNFPGEQSADALAASARKDGYPAVRVNALRALSRIDPEKAAALSRQVIQTDADAQVRDAAEAVLRSPDKGTSRSGNDR